MRISWIVAVGSLAVAPLAQAAAPRTVDEVIACQLRTRPLVDTVRHVRLVRRDRIGGERSYRARVYGGVSRQGLRTLLVQVSDPPELRDFSLLAVEREGANHIFVSPAGLPEVKLVRGAPGTTSLFGTDFSYEDIERLYGLVRPGETQSLAGDDETLDGRPVWKLETVPKSGSVYGKIVWQVDRKTCVLLRAELYEPAGSLRKVLTADPASIRRERRVWVAHDLRMQDLRDGTETQMLIDEIHLHADGSGVPFTPEELEAYKRAQNAQKKGASAP